MKTQTENDIEARGNGKVLMLKMEGFLGNGAVSEGDEVTVGLSTNQYSLDIPMSKEQARALSEKLAKVPK